MPSAITVERNERELSLLGSSYDPFQAIGKTYREMRAAHKAGTEDFDEHLASSIESLRIAYRQGRQKPLGTFDCLAYMIQYAPVGMAAVRGLMRRLENQTVPPSLSVSSSRPLEVVSIGAGPGTDLFGFLLGLAIQPMGIVFTRVDLHTCWGKYYKAFREDFKRQMPALTPILDGMTSRFQQIDLAKEVIEESDCREALSRADIIIVNRVLSVLGDVETSYDTIQQVARAAPHNSLGGVQE